MEFKNGNCSGKNAASPASITDLQRAETTDPSHLQNVTLMPARSRRPGAQGRASFCLTLTAKQSMACRQVNEVNPSAQTATSAAGVFTMQVCAF